MSKLINRIMQRLERGMSEEEIKEELDANRKTIHKCKREFDARNSIKVLIEQERLDEAQDIANELETKLMDKNTLFVLLELAIKKGDIKQGKKILKVLRIRQLNYEEQKRSIYLALELEPDNMELLDELIRIERKQGNDKQKKALLDRKEQIAKNKISNKRKNMLDKFKVSDFEEPKEILGNLQRARALIYQEQDVMEVAEEVNKLLEGKDAITEVLVQAELFAHIGLRNKAEALLKKFRKELDEKVETAEIRAINQAIELVRSSKTMPYEWKEFWKEIEKDESMIGNDEGR